jgi:GGDEF domain-containing protein
MPMASDSGHARRPRVLSPGVFDAVLETELKRAVRGQNFVTLVVMDTRREWDGLMLSADEGTLVGLADVVGREVRDTDPLGHDGKGALAVLLIDADYEHSTRVVDRLVGRIENHEFPMPLHIAIGAACYPTHAVDAGSLRRQAMARPIVNWRGGHGAHAERN